jgi:hypothetical protein
MVNCGVMIKQASLQSIKLTAFEDPKLLIENGIVDLTLQSQIFQDAKPELLDISRCVYLGLEDLKCFEVVDSQYEEQGVLFNNCIAIQPSNPAFPPHSGSVVLMGSPKSGLLEATFLNPVSLVKVFVTSSQRLVFSAYGSDRQLLTQTILPGANLAHSDSAVPPNTLLTVTSQNIHRVTFCAFDGQFTIDDFSFCF